MTILDFREIAPTIKRTKKDYGGKLDDFEKFAQEFFHELYDAKFIEIASRGADGGRDLLFDVQINGKIQKWVVSCKHTAHSGNAVGAEEQNISDRFAASGADVFVGFYSHIISSGLQKTLIEMERHNQSFVAKTFNSARIESTLLSSENAKGWLLAARHFPNSFVRLFQRFLLPINHYKPEDILDDGEGRLELPHAGGAITFYQNENQKAQQISYLLEHANDSVTFALNEAFFSNLLTDITNKWPTCFAYWEACPPAELRTSDIYPTFSVEDIVDIFKKESAGTAIIVCFLWTWWDEERAIDTYRKAFHAALENEISDKDARTNLGIRNALIVSPINIRDLITRFVAFSDADLSELGTWEKISLTAVQNGRGDELQILLKEIHEKAKNSRYGGLNKGPSDPALAQLKDYVYILGYDAVYKHLEKFINSMNNYRYRQFGELQEEGATWKIKPSNHYDWFANRIANPTKI